MIGQTISHYTILEKVGEGGMGVVYKAHDTTLDRDVALKFLPHDLTTSEEERTRFIHEAKAASALDHPNICTIYEVGQTPDGQMFIAMGYYGGESLTKKIHKGRLKVEEAVEIAIQVAEGLQAAHNREIVHRDIKSGNIVVTHEGQVKILDFGLAHKSGLSRLTRTGTTVGTAPYMSPEQAKGDKVDQRSDLWSLGVVLYEMVTGKLPFRGEHEAAILYSVVNEQPQPIEETISNASPELIHVINRAMEKDVGERYQTAADMLIDLRRLKKETSRTGYQPVRVHTKKSMTWEIILAAVVFVTLCVVGYFFFLRKGIDINVNFMQRIIDVPYQNDISASVSPSGKWVVFAASDKNNIMDLYVVSAGGGVPRRITFDSTSPPISVSWRSDPRVSPDNSEIIYTRFLRYGKPELCRVPLVGGQVLKLGEGIFGKWSPDGKRIGYVKYPDFSESGRGEYWSMRPDGSDNHRVFIDTVGIALKNPGETLIVYYFDWSPSDNSIAWLRRTSQLSCDILIHNLNSGKESKITKDTTLKTSLCWMKNGMIVYRSSGEDGAHLWAIPDGGGAPMQITRGTGIEEFPSISSDGSVLLFNSGRSTHDLGVGKVGGSEPVKIATIEGDVHFSPDISPSKDKIIFPKSYTGSTSYNLTIIDRDGTNERSITKGVARSDLMPLWSPHGEWVAFISRKTFEPLDSFKVYIANPRTMEPPRLVFDGYSMGGWINDSELNVRHYFSERNKIEFASSIRVRLDGSSPVRLAADSICPFIVDEGKFVLYIDYRRGSGSNPMRIVPMERWNKDGGADPQVYNYGVPDPWPSSVPHDGSHFELWCDPEKGDLWRIWYPDARKERIIHSCDLLKGIQYFNMSWDESEYVFFSKRKYVSSIGLIENLFQ